MNNRSFTAQVIHGEKVGRTIGFPTANLDLQLTKQDLNPGVYLSHVTLLDQPDQPSYHGLAYFGPRYIFGEERHSFEVYLYDFAGDLYDQQLQVKLTQFIREPLNLDTIDKLKNQLEADKQAGLELLN